MSNLHPGGYRGNAFGRIFGVAAIQRATRRRSYERGFSIAEGNRHGGPHEHKREIARRLRQKASQ